MNVSFLVAQLLGLDRFFRPTVEEGGRQMSEEGGRRISEEVGQQNMGEEGQRRS